MRAIMGPTGVSFVCAARSRRPVIVPRSNAPPVMEASPRADKAISPSMRPAVPLAAKANRRADNGAERNEPLTIAKSKLVRANLPSTDSLPDMPRN